VHGIIFINDSVGGKDFSPLQNGVMATHTPFLSPSRTIGAIVRGLKIGVTKWFRRNTDFFTVWRRNYYEHIIRNEESLNRLRQYVMDNSVRWVLDRENPLVGGDGAV
jgi:REP element-mobilizing transposase RayT